MLLLLVAGLRMGGSTVAVVVPPGAVIRVAGRPAHIPVAGRPAVIRIIPEQ